jgi:hypothetical protein
MNRVDLMVAKPKTKSAAGAIVHLRAF